METSLALLVTDCVNIICLSRWGSESPSLHLFHLLEETQLTTPPHRHHTYKYTVALDHNSVVMRPGRVCVGCVGNLVSLLFAEGELWLHARPCLTPYALSSVQPLSLDTHMQNAHVILNASAGLDLKHRVTFRLCYGDQLRSCS